MGPFHHHLHSICKVPVLLISLSLLAKHETQAQRPPQNPIENVGVESCGECHEEMLESWEQSAHARSYETLAKTQAAKDIISILGISENDIMTKASCVRCHYTQEAFSGSPQTTAAVSCESCHGSGDKWIDHHNKKSLSRGERIARATNLGMNHPGDIHSTSKTCYECHVIDDEQLVNQAGHPAVSRGFELLSWYSGEANHNFLIQKAGRSTKSHTSQIQPIPSSRKRMLYLTGKLLHLSSTLKAMAFAQDAPVDSNGNFIKLKDGRYTFGVQHTIEVQRILRSMKEVQAKVKIPEYDRAIAITSALAFTTGQQAQFTKTAEEIETLTREFTKNNTGSNFAAIDAIVNQLNPRYSSSHPKVGVASTR